MASATPDAGFVPGQPSTYDIDLTAQNWLGDQQASTITVATTTMVNPFGTGSLGFAPTFSYSPGVSTGAAVWWQASATAGAYDLKFEGFTDTLDNIPTANPAIKLSGKVVTLKGTVAGLRGWNANWSSSALVYGYSTAVTSSTENIYFRAFDTTGKATSPLVRVATNVSNDTRWYVAQGNNRFAFAYVKVDGANTGYYASNFNTTTGALSPATFVPETGFTRFDGAAARFTSSGNLMLVLEGVENGHHVIAIDKLSPSFVNQGRTTTVTLTGADAERFQVASVYNPNTNAHDALVLAFVDGGHVHLRLFNENGVQVGSDFIVPGITNFDRINALGSRVEIDYQAADPNGGTDILGYIYDTATAPYSYTANGGEWVGTPFNDTITDGGGINAVNGGGGTDTFVVNHNAADVVESIDTHGSVLITTPNSSDRLERFSAIRLQDATIAVKGNVLTQKDLQGKLEEISTYNVSGKPYTGYSKFYGSSGDVVSQTFYVERDTTSSSPFSSSTTSTTVLNGGNLTLTGKATFNGGSILGSHTLTTQGATSLLSLVIGGGVTWVNGGTISQTGNLQLGDGSVATLSNLAGATYAIKADVGISGSAGKIVNAGLLEKTAGSAVSTIAPAITNNGTIAALRGTLDLQGALNGTGNLQVSNGATLELDAAVGSGQTITFASTNDTLLLGDPTTFRGTVAGFAASDKIDLAGVASGGAKLYYTPNADNSGGSLKILSGSTRVYVAMDGAFLASSFHVAADSAGTGTVVTYTPPAEISHAGLAASHA